MRIQEVAGNLQKILECTDAEEISEMELTMTWCVLGNQLCLVYPRGILHMLS